MAEIFNFLSFERKKKEERNSYKVSKSSIWKLKNKLIQEYKVVSNSA